jgi:hypothetical protein
MLVANLHSWLVVIITVFLTGVVFTRMISPGMTASLGNCMLFDHRDGVSGRVLTTRFYFHKENDSLINTKFQIRLVSQSIALVPPAAKHGAP